MAINATSLSISIIIAKAREIDWNKNHTLRSLSGAQTEKHLFENIENKFLWC